MYDYLISFSTTEPFVEATIHHTKSKLKVRAFDLSSVSFKPCKGEIKFFVTSDKETLVFETKGYNRQRKLLILHMISWYCVYRGLNKPQIHSALPLAS